MVRCVNRNHSKLASNVFKSGKNIQMSLSPKNAQMISLTPSWNQSSVLFLHPVSILYHSSSKEHIRQWSCAACMVPAHSHCVILYTKANGAALGGTWLCCVFIKHTGSFSGNPFPESVFLKQTLPEKKNLDFIIENISQTQYELARYDW